MIPWRDASSGRHAGCARILEAPKLLKWRRLGSWSRRAGITATPTPTMSGSRSTATSSTSSSRARSMRWPVGRKTIPRSPRRSCVSSAMRIGDRPCRVHTSDLRIYVEAGRSRHVPGRVGHLRRSRATRSQPRIDGSKSGSPARGDERFVRGLRYGREARSVSDDSVVARVRHRFASRTQDHGASSRRRTMAVACRDCRWERCLVETVGAELVVDSIYRQSSVVA